MMFVGAKWWQKHCDHVDKSLQIIRLWSTKELRGNPYMTLQFLFLGGCFMLDLFFCVHFLVNERQFIFELWNCNLHQKKVNGNHQFFSFLPKWFGICGRTSQALRSNTCMHITSYYQNGFCRHIPTCHRTSHFSKLQQHIASHALETSHVIYVSPLRPKIYNERYCGLGRRMDLRENASNWL